MFPSSPLRSRNFPCSSPNDVIRITILEFPSGLVVRTWHFHHQGPGSIPGLGTEILHQATAHCGQSITKEGLLEHGNQAFKNKKKKD